MKEVTHAAGGGLVENHCVGCIGYTAHNRLHEVFGFDTLRGFVESDLGKVRHKNIIADKVVRFLGRADGDTAADTFDDKRLVAPLKRSKGKAFHHVFFAKQPRRELGKHFGVHTPDDTCRILHVCGDDRVYRTKDEELFPCHIELYERGEANLTGLDDNDTDGLAVLVAVVNHTQQFALSSVEGKENILGVERVLVFDIEERSGAKLEVVAAACLDEFAADDFEINLGVSQPETMEISTDRETAVAQVGKDFLVVAVERYLVVYPAEFDSGERETGTRGTALTGNGVVGLRALAVTLGVDM